MKNSKNFVVSAISIVVLWSWSMKYGEQHRTLDIFTWVAIALNIDNVINPFRHTGFGS